MGHLHSSAGIEMHSINAATCVWDTGWLWRDMNHVAMRYGKTSLNSQCCLLELLLMDIPT